VDGLTPEELALSAGVDGRLLGGLERAGVIAPDPDGRFRASDIARVRVALGLVGAGLELDVLADAVSSGRLSLAFVDTLMDDPSHWVDGGDITDPLDAAVQRVLGTERGPSDPMRTEDAEIVEVLKQARELGASDRQLEQIVHAMTVSVHHLVNIQRDFVDEVLLAPAIERTGSTIEALESTAETRRAYRALGRRLSQLLMERLVDDAVFQNLVLLTESSLGASGVVMPVDGDSVAFVDISGYTRRSEIEGDTAAAHQGQLLGDVARSLATEHRGRLVRTLGDGAFVHFDQPSDAVRFALELVASAPSAGLWELHAGVNTGPMIRRDGDYFGSAVNIASRIADRAGAGEVKVSRAVVDAWSGRGVQFVRPEELQLKNVADPITVLSAVADR
jgi:adenylate cyclase